MEVYGEQNEILCDRDNVLRVWQDDFEKLYNDGFEEFNTSDQVTNLKNILHFQEQQMLEPLYNEAFDINKDISVEEVIQVAVKSKLGKSVGIDLIPNEVLKNRHIIETLQTLFQLCFDTGKLPSLWLQSIIKPIPKSKDNDPRIPTNYRGISLISCTAKFFTGILNNRISKFLDDNRSIVEEQNGFRKKRSCTDHIYVLESIIKTRQERKQDTFVTFIDFSKAFDRVNRECVYLNS